MRCNPNRFDCAARDQPGKTSQGSPSCRQLPLLENRGSLRLLRSRVEMEGEFGGGGYGGGCGAGGSGIGGGLREERQKKRKTPILEFDGGQPAEQQLARLRELKNSLVGDEEAKRSALALSVVKDVLAFLDAAGDGDSGGQFYELSLLHGVGLLTILCSPLPEALAEMYVAPSGSRIVRHIARAMEMASVARKSGDGGSIGRNGSSEKLTATVLRAVSSLCTCLVPATTTCSYEASADKESNNEKFKTLAALKEVSGEILNGVVASPNTTGAGIGGGGRSRPRWPPSLVTLGLEALAAMTRVEVKKYAQQYNRSRIAPRCAVWCAAVCDVWP